MLVCMKDSISAYLRTVRILATCKSQQCCLQPGSNQSTRSTGLDRGYIISGQTDPFNGSQVWPNYYSPCNRPNLTYPIRLQSKSQVHLVGSSPLAATAGSHMLLPSSAFNHHSPATTTTMFPATKK
jgi:hypothetical protein